MQVEWIENGDDYNLGMAELFEFVGITMSF